MRAFGAVIDEVRDKIQSAFEKQNGDMVSNDVASIIDGCLRPIARRLRLDCLQPASLSVLRNYMAVYDQAEGRGVFASFYGHMVKTVENLQSVMHIVEYAGQDGAAPAELANSKAVRDRLWYAERNLHGLFAAAHPGCPHQLALARACAELAYENCLKILESAPAAIDRSAVMKHQLNAALSDEEITRAESSPYDATARHREIAATLRRIFNRASHQDAPPPEISRRQLQAAYAAALDELRKNPDFRPPSKALVDHDVLPPAIAARIDQARAALSKQAP